MNPHTHRIHLAAVLQARIRVILVGVQAALTIASNELGGN